MNYVTTKISKCIISKLITKILFTRNAKCQYKIAPKWSRGGLGAMGSYSHYHSHLGKLYMFLCRFNICILCLVWLKTRFSTGYTIHSFLIISQKLKKKKFTFGYFCYEKKGYPVKMFTFTQHHYNWKTANSSSENLCARTI